MKHFMVVMTNGQYVARWADALCYDEDGNIILKEGNHIVGKFNFNNIAGWVDLTKNQEEKSV